MNNNFMILNMLLNKKNSKNVINLKNSFSTSTNSKPIHYPGIKVEIIENKNKEENK